MTDGPREIRIHVDELVLDGLPELDPRDPAALRRAVTDAVLGEGVSGHDNVSRIAENAEGRHRRS